MGAQCSTLRAPKTAPVLDRLMATEGSLTAAGSFESRLIEPCPDILARTTGKQAVTDDNMGSEWRYFLGLE